MLFLYNNETEINEKDLDFSYRLTKYLKKIRIGNDIYDTLAQESDVEWFLSRADELDINSEWRQIIDSETSEYQPIIFNKKLPIEIELNHEKNKIQCILKNRLKWLQNPLEWLPFPSDRGSTASATDTLKEAIQKLFKLYG